MAEPRRIVIVGAGPQAKVAIDIFQAAGRSVLGLLDDDPAKAGTSVRALPILGGVAWGLETLPDDIGYFVAIGGNTPRVRLADRLRSAGRRLVNAVHPSAVLAGGAVLGENVLVCAQGVVGVEAVLHDDSVVNTAATVDHESVIGTGAYLAPGVHTAGRVSVGREAFVGAATTIGPNVDIGEHAIVGAASLVLRDVPARVYAWGRPAAVVREVTSPVNWAALLGGRSPS